MYSKFREDDEKDDENKDTNETPRVPEVPVIPQVPSEPEVTEPEETGKVVGHRHCSCGASFDIRANSGLDSDAWKAHVKEHAAKEEIIRWTDK